MKWFLFRPLKTFGSLKDRPPLRLEILEDLSDIDYLFVPVGGGGLASGVGTYFKTYSPKTRIIGLEPEGAPSMDEAFKAGSSRYAR